MRDSTGQKSEDDSSKHESKIEDSRLAIRQNLSNFLNPGLPAVPITSTDPNGALQLRMAQMELANKMRLNQDSSASNKPVPPVRPPQSGGFGSSHGAFHLQRPNFGQAKITASKPSPYQQVFANASKSPEQAAPVLKHDEIQEVTDNNNSRSDEDDVLEIPEGSEVRQDLQQKASRLKRFRNPSL